MAKVGLNQTNRWKDQTLADAIAWHAATGSLTPANEPAYRAGYDEGYRAAISALRCHGYIDTDLDR